ncbi:hypothetical protein D3C77_748210 [compost metagenome]
MLIYPRTGAFDRPLPVFEIPKTDGLRLWVLPFCLKSRQLMVPDNAPFKTVFKDLCGGLPELRAELGLANPRQMA